MSVREDNRRLLEAYTKISQKCICGCVVKIPAYRDKLECRWCGRTVINKTKCHFKYKLRKTMEKVQIK